MVGDGNHYLFNLDDYSFTRIEIYDKYFRSNLIADFIDKKNMYIFDMKEIANVIICQIIRFNSYKMQKTSPNKRVAVRSPHF